MSYPYQQPGGYPSQGGYPQQGYPQPGYPQQPGYPTQPGMPTPQSAGYGAYPSQGPGYGGGYPGQQTGMPMPDYGAGTPYPAQPAPVGFQVAPSSGPSGGMPQYGMPGAPAPAQPGYPTGHPYQQNPSPYPSGQAPYPGQPGGHSPYPGAQPPAQAPYPGQYGAPAAPPQEALYPSMGGGGHSPVPVPGGSVPPSRPAPPTHQMQKMSIGSKQKTEGTVKTYSPFSPDRDAELLRKAMKGFGTDEKAIIDVLAYRTNAQRQEIRTMFKTMYGKDLIRDLKSELGGRFEDVIIALMVPSVEYDAECLRNAIAGAGTDESTLMEIMCSRNNAQIHTIKDTYKRLYKKDLEKDLRGDLSGHFERLMVSMSTGGRMENLPVDHAKAAQDAQALYAAGAGRLGTDESKFNQVLASQSYEQLQVVFEEYHKQKGKTIEAAIKSEMSGDLEDALLTIVKCVRNRPAFFAERLYKSMKGAGTKDNQLIRVVVTRSEVDMVQIKDEFRKQYGKTLESFIQDDASGDYKRALLALVSGRK